MLKDKLIASDYEATNEALEQQVAQESYLEFLRENEKRNRKRQRGTASGGESPRGSSSPRSGRVSPKVGCSTQGSSQSTTKTSPRNSPRLSTVREDPSCSSRYSPKPCSSKDHPGPSESTGASYVSNFPPEMFGEFFPHRQKELTYSKRASVVLKLKVEFSDGLCPRSCPFFITGVSLFHRAGGLRRWSPRSSPRGISRRVFPPAEETNPGQQLGTLGRLQQ